MREIVLDTETTGLDPKNGDRLVEIACLELVNRIPTSQVWHEYFNPQRSMPKEAFAVHGLSDTFLADKPLFAALAQSFLDFIGDDTLVIHNANFDVNFLNHELGRVGLPLIRMERVVDTLALARRKHPGAPNNLDALCKRYSVDASARTVHGALVDTELLADVYIAMIGGQQAQLDLNQESVRQSVANGPRRKRPAPLPPRLTPEETEAHRGFMETLGANRLWTLYEPPAEPQATEAK